MMRGPEFAARKARAIVMAAADSVMNGSTETVMYAHPDKDSAARFVKAVQEELERRGYPIATTAADGRMTQSPKDWPERILQITV